MGVVEIVRDEQLAPGEALASSRDLAKRFDVTTPTVREALRRLEATGYDDRERDHAEHVRILAAISEGDPTAAEALTRTHLESIRKAIETAQSRTS
jgi:DNA-binding FadR family transcriptional regulator